MRINITSTKLVRKEQIELTEREERIYRQGRRDEFTSQLVILLLGIALGWVIGFAFF